MNYSWLRGSLSRKIKFLNEYGGVFEYFVEGNNFFPLL